MIVRGIVPYEIYPDIVMAIMMKEYHQQYSEILNMPEEKVLFFVSLHSDILALQKHQSDKLKNKRK